MKNRIIKLIVFLFCTVSFIISLKLMWNLGVFVDEYNLSPDIVWGGDLELYMDWIRLVSLGIASVLSFVNLFLKDKKI